MELIAVASDDGQSVAEHFGGASQYVVLGIDGGSIARREVREKPKHEGRGIGGGGRGQGKRRRIDEALSTIRDCGTVVARSIGDRAFEGIEALGFRPLATDLETIDQVAQAAIVSTFLPSQGRIRP